jgi:hypothetical protein
MNQQATNATYALIELLLNYAEAQAAGTALLKRAHAEGRLVSMDELKAIRSERIALNEDLDDAIAQAEANEAATQEPQS